MFVNLFFLLLALALINFVPETHTVNWIHSSALAFGIGIGLYVLFLFLLFLQIHFLIDHNKKRSAHVFTQWTNVETLLFLAVFHFGLGAQRLLAEGPILGRMLTPFAFLSLLMYLGALTWSHYWLARDVLRSSHPLSYAYHQILFIIPFCFPFLIFSLFFDGVNFLPQSFLAHFDSPLGYAFFIVLSLALLISIVLFLPPVIMMCWRCKPLKDPALVEGLNRICEFLHFRHGGFKIWTVMKHALTAGVIGIVPRFRYIMFTERLLHEFKPEEIEAIVIHEIGHIHHRHLFFYPFVFLGMVVVASLFSHFYTPGIERFYDWQMQHYPSDIWQILLPLTLFIPYAFILAVYLRLVFGFFSRLFERQADLHIFEYPCPPEYMIQALDHIAIATGYTHRQPNWHHFSVQQRMDFLRGAIRHPERVMQHHRKVKKWIWIYFILLGLGCLLLWFLS